MRGGPVEALHGELMLEGPVADPERAIGSDLNNARSSSRVSILPRLDMVGPQPVGAHGEHDDCCHNKIAGEFFGYEELEQ